MICFLKNNKKVFIVAILQWFCIFFFKIDKLFFTYDKVGFNYWLVKSILFLFLIGFWSLLFFVYKQIKEGNRFFTRASKVFIVYFCLILFVLIIIWPGCFSWDDTWTLERIQTYESFDSWQNALTGLYQDVLLQVFPCPGGIILLQNILISFCVAYIVTKIEATFEIYISKNWIIDTMIKIIPFLLPPVIRYQFSGYRIGIYVYLELLLFTIFITMLVKKEKWSMFKVVLVSILLAIISFWRSESILYIPLFVILFLIQKKEYADLIKKIVFVCITFCVFLGLNKWQNSMQLNQDYKVVSLIRPCVELVRVAGAEDEEQLNAINKVIDLDIVNANPSLNGEQLYFIVRSVKNDYSLEDYNRFFSAFIKLSIKYPGVVIKERCNLFLNATGIGEIVTYNEVAEGLYNEEFFSYAAEYFHSQKWCLNHPLSVSLRKAVVCMITKGSVDGNHNIVWESIFWNAMIPIVMLLVSWIVLMVKKQRLLFWCNTFVLMKLAVVVLTAPSNWIMYYMSFYVLGYSFFAYSVYYFICKGKMQNEKKSSFYTNVQL